MTDRSPEHYLLEWFRELFGENSQQYRDLAEKCRRKPGRISSAYKELLSGYDFEASSIPHPTVALTEEDDYRGRITASEIDFTAVCGHHFLPFFGTVEVRYVPGRMIVGLGKIPRLVHARTKRITIQEHITRDICSDMIEHVGATAAYVRTTARHLCVCARGPKVDSLNVVEYSIGSSPLENW